MSNVSTLNGVDVDAKLSVNKFRVDKTNPHIVVVKEPEMAELRKLLIACPAGLYKLNNDGSLQFDYAGCLECGTCRILCGKTILEKWQYPQGTLGVEYQYG